MRIHAFICTRTRDLSATTQKLVSYLSRCRTEVKLIVGSDSIFKAYTTTLEKADPDPEDIIILCHDDIEILLSEGHFLQVLITSLLDPKTGFIGPAGTTELTSRGVWWDQEQWSKGKHRGFVIHGDNLSTGSNPTYYGAYGPVAVLDGLFLAAKARTLNKIDLNKPSYFDGDWDFYDIHYTYAAKRAGLTNKAAPILLMHNSSGELVGRDSWHKNREAFVTKNQANFPITI